MNDPYPVAATVRLKRRPAPLSFALVAVVIVLSTVNLVVTESTAASNHHDVQRVLTTIESRQVHGQADVKQIASNLTQINNDRAFETLLETEVEDLAAQLVKAGITPALIPLPLPPPKAESAK